MTMFTPDPDDEVLVAPPNVNIGSVLEGRCPTCGAMLERQADCGWCPTCKVGHSATMRDGEGEHRVHLDGALVGSTLGGSFRAGPGRVVIITKISSGTPPTAD